MEENKKNVGKVVSEAKASIFALQPLFSDPEKLFYELGVFDHKVYKHVPSECYDCGHDKFRDLSLLGIHETPLFYECVKCEALHLRFTEEWIAEQLRPFKDAIINPIDWEEEPAREDYS